MSTSPSPPTFPSLIVTATREPGPRGRLEEMVASVRDTLSGTPGRMRTVGILTIAATLFFGLAAGQAFRSADGALGRAAANSDQLVRIQAIQTNVVQADADATNAFLVGGLEPVAQRADYTDAVSAASGLVAEAAQHQPADGAALGALNRSLVAYTSQVEQARANNRQALPIGAQYLKGASADLRTTALPLLKNLGEANTERVTEEFDRAARSAVWLVGAGVLTLIILVLAMVWLARRTRRYLNVPLAGAALVVLVTLVLGTAGLLSVRTTVDVTRDGVYAATLSTAQVRTAGFDAKSNESLTLIARGSGAAFQKAWQGSADTVTAGLAELAQNPASSGLAPLPWSDYASVHQKIRARDDSGDWEGAVALATGLGNGSGNTAFAAFDASSGTQLATLSEQTSRQLGATGGWLPVAGALGVLAGLLAAASAWWGVSLRLEEYR
ncbi:MAG: hypothetical protein ABIQ61_05325 [Ornithinibacter sp.]